MEDMSTTHNDLIIGAGNNENKVILFKTFKTHIVRCNRLESSGNIIVTGVHSTLNIVSCVGILL